MATTVWDLKAGLSSPTEADNVDGYAEEAAASATAAAASQAAAASSASAAASSASSASTSATSATASASTASTSAAAASADAATASSAASTASTAATNASASESAAATSASNAASSASSASSSASAASASASSAATSASDAAATYDSFDDRYLGAKSSEPTVDNDGDPLLTGALYWSTSANQLYVYDGALWRQGAFTSGSGMVDLVDDLTPQLGGDLDLNSYSVTGTGGINITGDIALTGTVDGRDVAADGTKLDGIEAGATADQTAGEIKTAYESNADTNAFTDAEKTKLAGVEAGATADQSASEIKTAYESNADTNAFTDAEKTKLAGIEAGADVTDATNVAAAGAVMTSDIGTTVQAYDADLTAWAGKTAPTGDAVGTSDTQTLTNKTLTDPAITGTIIEDVYAISGTTPALDPSNGSIQTWTLTANSTPTDSLASGEAITLMIDDGTAYTVTWPTMTWVNNAGSAPTLATTGYTVIALWKVSTTLYGALIGDGS